MSENEMTLFLVHFTNYDYKCPHSIWSTEAKAEKCIAEMTEYQVKEGYPEILEVTLDGGEIELC